jgi:hypothetical protein
LNAGSKYFLEQYMERRRNGIVQRKFLHCHQTNEDKTEGAGAGGKNNGMRTAFPASHWVSIGPVQPADPLADP